MTYDELYIDGLQVDIKDVTIERDYTSPYFSDVTKVLSDTTKSITLPPTERNKAVMEYLQRPDMNTDFPYKYHTANYYQNGMQLITNGRVNVIGDFEIQIVYGVNREKYLPLKEKKLNEIVPNGTTILASDWIVNWDLAHMCATGKKYKCLDYVNREITSDVITLDGVIQPKIEPDDPMKDNVDAMSSHPFVAFSDMLDLINEDNIIADYTYLTTQLQPSQPEITFTVNIADILKIGDVLEMLGDDLVGFTAVIKSFPDNFTARFSGDVSEFYADGIIAKIHTLRYIVDFTPLKERVNKKGLILGGLKDDYSFSRQFIYSEFPPEGSQYLYLGDVAHVGILSISNYFVHNFVGAGSKYETEIVFDLDFTIDDYVLGLSLYKSHFDIETATDVEELVKPIPYASTSRGTITYKTVVTAAASSEDDFTYSFYIKFDRAGNLPYSFSEGSKITVSYSIVTSVFRYLDYYGNSQGRYNCLKNLPNVTHLEFINQMLIMAGMYISYDEKGDFVFRTLDEFKANYDSGNVYDWSGKLSNVRDSKYQFNSNAQKNWLRFNNYKKLSYLNDGYLQVDDVTQALERDLHKLEFDLAEKSAKGISEFILYKQTSTSNGETDPMKLQKTFKNEYSEKDSACVFDLNGIATNEQVLPNSVDDSRPLLIQGQIFATNIISIQEFYEPDFFVPEIGNRVLSLDGVDLEDVYIIKRDEYYLTLNKSILIVDELDHVFVFDRSTKGFIELYYSVHQKLINRPIVKEVDVLLDFFESSRIDFTKPVYIKEWGKYCLLLNLTAPNKGLCTAKLLLINQTL